MRKIILDKLEKTIIILFIILVTWFYLLSQYMQEITNLIGPVGIMVIFLCLIFPLLYCNYLWFGGGNPSNLSKWFEKWKKGSKKRKKYDIVFFITGFFCVLFVSYLDFNVFHFHGKYTLTSIIVLFPLVIIYIYFRPDK